MKTNESHESNCAKPDIFQVLRSQEETRRYAKISNDCLCAGRAYLEFAALDADQWIELAKDAWLNSDDGKYCSADIVSEFTANMDDVLTLVRTLLRTKANYPIKYSLRRPKRTAKQ